MKVDILSINAYAEWHWLFEGDNFCIICQSDFDHSCSQCLAPGEACPPVIGKCRHAYHLHCIERWLLTKKKDECPTCKQLWEFDFDKGTENCSILVDSSKSSY